MPLDLRAHRLCLWVLTPLVALFGVVTPPFCVAQPVPSLASSDPVVTGLMQGFPPPHDKTVRLSNLLVFPNIRWAYQHMRELGPTTAIRRAASAPSVLRETPVDLDDLRLDDGQGQVMTLQAWQQATFTDALLILHRGDLVYERYAGGMGPRHPHALNSLGKSLVGLLACQLMLEGRLDASAPITRYLPELRGSAWADATVQQTLDMTTHVVYDEDFSQPDAAVYQYLRAAGLLPATAAATQASGVLAFLATLAPGGQHGDRFRYKSVDTEVMAWLLQRVTGQRLSDLISERLWEPIGASEDAYVWTDPVGSEVGSVGISATARDLLRLGEMLRHDGRYQNRQILDPRVTVELRRGASPEKFLAGGQLQRRGYAYHDYWWIPHDGDASLEAKGLNGQHLYINPVAEVVLVKFSSHPVPNTLHTHAIDRAAFDAISRALRQRLP